MEFRIYDPILSSPMLPVFSVKNKLDVLWIGHVYSRSILLFFAVVFRRGCHYPTDPSHNNRPKPRGVMGLHKG